MGKVDDSCIYLWLFLRITTYNIRFHRVNIFQTLPLGIMLTATENEDYWAMTEDDTKDSSSAKLNDHDAGVLYRLRRKMNNKNYKQWEDHWQNNVPVDADFQKYKYEDSTQWNEKLLTKMHSTIQLEGRPDGKPYTKATKGQSDSGSS